MIVFNHLDTGMTYLIPHEGRRIDDIVVVGSKLKLSTNEIVEFQQRESAEQVWYLLDECFRKGWKRLTFSESAGMTYSMYND